MNQSVNHGQMYLTLLVFVTKEYPIESHVTWPIIKHQVRKAPKAQLAVDSGTVIETVDHEKLRCQMYACVQMRRTSGKDAAHI